MYDAWIAWGVKNGYLPRPLPPKPRRTTAAVDQLKQLAQEPVREDLE
jgi:hypothetical protein